MARNDEGEFELVLGNRQLVSVFLIVVILLGVFFSMGYIVGRNSAPVASADARKAIVVERPPTQPNSPVGATGEPPTEAKAAPPESTGTHPEQPAASTPAKPAPAPPPAPTKQAEKQPPKEQAKEQPKPQPPPAAGPASVTAEPSPGQYWQVVATSRPDAEIISEALGKKGFRSVITPAPKEGMFRVLVGPLKDAAALAQTRADLEASGFKNPMMRKY